MQCAHCHTAESMTPIHPYLWHNHCVSQDVLNHSQTKPDPVIHLLARCTSKGCTPGRRRHTAQQPVPPHPSWGSPVHHSHPVHWPPCRPIPGAPSRQQHGASRRGVTLRCCLLLQQHLAALGTVNCATELHLVAAGIQARGRRRHIPFGARQRAIHTPCTRLLAGKPKVRRAASSTVRSAVA